MSVSGRAGLFTMDNGKFFGDLRGTPYASNKRQASGALRLEFGQYTIVDGGFTSGTITTTVNTGIVSMVSPGWLPIVVTPRASGDFSIATPGAFTSAKMDIRVVATGQYSGSQSGMNVNYLVIGY
jgi:hypothetical protein